MYGFKKVSRFDNIDLEAPKRKTEHSAGYDFAAAESIVVPSIFNIFNEKRKTILYEDTRTITTLEAAADIFKPIGRPTLVSTGHKCHLPSGRFLQISVRSSCPLKYWLILANGVGIIDSDYYDNESNEGEIFIQLINLSPIDLLIKKGDVIAQGVILSYDTYDSEEVISKRVGGFGSTNG